MIYPSTRGGILSTPSLQRFGASALRRPVDAFGELSGSHREEIAACRIDVMVVLPSEAPDQPLLVGVGDDELVNIVGRVEAELVVGLVIRRHDLDDHRSARHPDVLG